MIREVEYGVGEREVRRDENQLLLHQILTSQGFSAADIGELDLGPHRLTLLDRVRNRAQARQHFQERGVVLMHPEMPFQARERLGDVTADVVYELRKRISGDFTFPDSQTVDKFATPKDMTAYNGTGRQMHVISADRVLRLPEVTQYQHTMLPLIRDLTGDPTVEVSVDPSEATVINLQVFHTDQANEMQQHGAHFDRVDTTVIACVENVGPGGDLVLAGGWFEACVDLGIDPNGQFKETLETVLAHRYPLHFQVVRMVPGDTVLLKSDTTLHFITPKHSGDVMAAFASDPRRASLPFGDTGGLLGRGIINVSYETETCRTIDRLSQALEAHVLRSDGNFREVDMLAAARDWITTVEIPPSLASHPPEALAQLCANASYGRLSSVDLYTD